MSEAKHSPEPWKIWLGFDAHSVVDANGECLLCSEHPFWRQVPRIVACINACQGIPNDALEQAAKGECLILVGKLPPDVQEAIRNAPDAGIGAVCPVCRRVMTKKGDGDV